MPTPYQSTPDSGLVRPAFKPNPLVGVEQTGQGTQSHPVPPKRVVFNRKLLPAPTLVKAPGAQGTI